MDSNIIFFGTETFSLSALESLVDAGYHLAAVVTKPDSAQGRGMLVKPTAVKTYALAHGLKVLQPQSLQEVEPDIADIPNRIGVLSSYGKIIPESTLGLFGRGIINIHPSLLPSYRGPAPIETAIFRGDHQTGVSLMRLVAKMDAGPIYAQTVIELPHDVTAASLYKICARTGSDLLLRHLPAITKNELNPIAQDEARATYTKLLSKHNGQVDPERQTAEEIERHIRAYEIYPRTRLFIHGHEVIVSKAHVAHPNATDLSVRCSHDTWLIIDSLVAPSGRTMSGADFQRGYSA